MTEPFTRHLAEESAALRDLDQAISDAGVDALIEAGRCAQAIKEGHPGGEQLDRAIERLAHAAGVTRRGIALVDLVFVRCPPPNEVTPESRQQLDGLRELFQRKLDDLVGVADMLKRAKSRTCGFGLRRRAQRA